MQVMTSVTKLIQHQRDLTGGNLGKVFVSKMCFSVLGKSSAIPVCLSES